VSANAVRSTYGCIENLSLSGALVKAEVDVGLHALIQVTFNLPSPAQRTAPITAYVSRKTEEGVGVEWCQFGPTAIKDLLRAPAIPAASRLKAPP